MLLRSPDPLAKSHAVITGGSNRIPDERAGADDR
jgi:hypothetical protein